MNGSRNWGCYLGEVRDFIHVDGAKLRRPGLDA